MSDLPDCKPISGGRDHAEPNPLEIHAEMRAFAARNLEQAKFACDKFMEAV